VVQGNHAPIAINDSYSTNVNTPLTIATPGVLGNDTDQDHNSLTVSRFTQASHGTVSILSNGSFTYTPIADYIGGDSFTYWANDGTVDSIQAGTVSLTVNSSNHAPIAINDSYSTNENTALTISSPGILANDTDADLDPLSVALYVPPTNGSLAIFTDGSFTYTPTPGYVGSDSFIYWVSDGTVNSVSPATVSLTINGPTASHSPARNSHADFSGDGRPDVLWRNANGEVVVWNSPAFAYQSFGVVTADWNIQGTGDFSGGQRGDILWRNNDGDTLVWNSNPGSETFSYQDFGVVTPDWNIQNVADFNHDGRTDILWRNDNGRVVIWDSNPGSETFSYRDYGIVTADWAVQDVADFNNDGSADILWRNSNTGNVVIWNSDGSQGFPYRDFGPVTSDWAIQGTADFNSDGRADILWRNNNNDHVVIWNSNAATQGFSYQDFGPVTTDWVVQAAADYNHDGRGDILWRNTNGDALIWNSNPGAADTFSYQDLGVVANNWNVA
jgi:hypothetical protein